MKVSFDFDGTLTRSDVQRYAKLLKKAGYEVHITTSRHKVHDLFDDEHRDLFEIAARIGIDDDKIHFLNCTDKAKFFMSTTDDFLFHLDDDWFVVDDINEHCNNIISVCVLADSWVLRCDELIKDKTFMHLENKQVRKRVQELIKNRKGLNSVDFLNLVKEDIQKLIKEQNNKENE